MSLEQIGQKIGAIHLDCLNLYNGWEGIHLKDIHEIAAKIIEGEIKLKDKNLFPFLEEL